ncbi:hypothetical protein R1flu_017124 [Riccia fluitans]|uniref:Uncharacterized protein n=1 Tax=Riccia fluitans TaxID=41844 RepID=A0ABD1YPD1_9MARC
MRTHECGKEVSEARKIKVTLLKAALLYRSNDLDCELVYQGLDSLLLLVTSAPMDLLDEGCSGVLPIAQSSYRIS